MEELSEKKKQRIAEQKRLQKATQRANEIEDWLLENSFTHPKWDEYVNELHALSVTINRLDGVPLSTGTNIVY